MGYRMPRTASSSFHGYQWRPYNDEAATLGKGQRRNRWTLDQERYQDTAYRVQLQAKVGART